MKGGQLTYSFLKILWLEGGNLARIVRLCYTRSLTEKFVKQHNFLASDIPSDILKKSITA
jgi:hypothetical protein